jgi:hypothetical protein
VQKIKMLKPGYYNCNYPAGSVVEVDDNYARFVIELGEAVLAKPEDKITDPVPYIMAPKKSSTEEAIHALADAIVQGQARAAAQAQTPVKAQAPVK